MLSVVCVLLVMSGCAAQMAQQFDTYFPSEALKSQVVSMPAMNIAANMKLSEDTRNLTKAFDFAEVHTVNMDFLEYGAVSSVENGFVRSLQFEMPNSLSMAFYFSSFNIPAGAAVFLVPEHGPVAGPWTSANRFDSGEFQTWHVGTTVVTVVYFTPEEAVTGGELVVGSVATAFQPMLAGACNIQSVCRNPENTCNSACEGGRTCSYQCTYIDQNAENPQWAGEDWSTEANAVVAMLSAAGSRFCSGSFINNGNADAPPRQLVLTAAHCSVSTTTLIKQGFINTVCASTDNEGGNTTRVAGNIRVLAQSSTFDSTLIEIGDRIPEDWQVYMAGYNAEPEPADGVVAIHHPRRSNQKITHTSIPIYSSGYGPTRPGDSHWVVDHWTEGTTEGGSSGSPIFNFQHQILGQLHGGSAACSNAGGPTGWDAYGALWQSYKLADFSQNLGPSTDKGGRFLYDGGEM